eukprot:TRINITY_DN91724_c0_g1_i1.p1 TRINITY_DN91724_c0_g1~~TRINITY_DN91724_c0_g1_i1.p1  ORF type:complete len:264 (-),score=57.98 TRINITY_DN91724_c0_g1_i1:206-997(-)
MSSSTGGGNSGYAANVLKEMYGGNLPRAAKQLLADHAKSRSTSAPAKPSRWLGATGEVVKQRKSVDLRVPRVGRGGGLAGLMRPPPMPSSGKKPLAHILAETENYKRQDEQLAIGRDYSVEKQRHQDKCAYGFGSALPTTHAPAGYVPPAPPRRRVTFHSLPASREGSPRAGHGSSGLTDEQSRMAEEIVQSVRQRQMELDAVEESLARYTDQAEKSSQSSDRRKYVMKEMANVSRRRLELKNAMHRDVQDLEKLIDLAPGDE